MGKQWVGFQTLARPVQGRTIVEQLRFTVPSAAGLVALVTTANGLRRWLADTTTFSPRLGGTIDFVDEVGAFGGSFTRLDVPHRVVLVTERHGEIAVGIDVRTEPPTVDARVSRFIADGEDEDAARGLLGDVLERLREATLDGR